MSFQVLNLLITDIHSIFHFKLLNAFPILHYIMGSGMIGIDKVSGTTGIRHRMLLEPFGKESLHGIHHLRATTLISQDVE